MSTSSAYYWNNEDPAYFFYNPVGSIADNETQFLSFELNSNTMFNNTAVSSGMHLAISLRGDSYVTKDGSNHLTYGRLEGRGLAIHHTEGAPNGCFGVAVEDFSLNISSPGLVMCDSYQSLGFSIQNNSRYRIDLHVSKGWVAYWIFKKNPTWASTSWNFLASGSTPAPEQAMDATGGDSVIISTAFRNNPPVIIPPCETKAGCDNERKLPLGMNYNIEEGVLSYGITGPTLSIRKVYVAKWTNP